MSLVNSERFDNGGGVSIGGALLVHEHFIARAALTVAVAHLWEISWLRR